VIIAVFSRVLRPGVSVDDLVAAWAPESSEEYPAEVEVGVDPSDDRRVVTVIRFDGSLDQFNAELPRLVHADSQARLAALVESTELERVYESVDVEL